MFSLLNDLTTSDSKKYGSKAEVLGGLLKSGMRLPNGFALSSEVFREFLCYNRFPYKTEDYPAHNRDIINFILHGRFSGEIIDSLRSYFHELSPAGDQQTSFVVRSSALCEDTENHSFAGVFESFVNLCSFSELVDSLKKCYASLFSDKALAMMIRCHFPLQDLQMGVIVQEFINGSISGVTFSADPVNMDSGAVMVNAVNGSCAGFVNGKSISSLYKLHKDTGEIMESIIQPGSPLLSHGDCSQLYETILRIENLLGYYQDVEWTIRDHNLYILQSRPITTFRDRNYPKSWFVDEDLEDTLDLSGDKPLTPLLQDLQVKWHEATCKGFAYSSKGKNGRCRIYNGYFYSAVDERDKEKRAQFRVWMEDLLKEGKSIFHDLQLPQIMPLREELKTILEDVHSPTDLKEILKKAVDLLMLSVEINVSAVDGGCVPLEAFEKHCLTIDPGFSPEDFYDLVYGISKLSAEREAVIQLALSVKAKEELVKLFAAYQYDEILYAHLANSPEGQELLAGIDEYLKDYGLITVKGQWVFDSPILLEQPWFVIGKIRACLGIDIDLFFKSRENSLLKKTSVVQKLTAGMNEMEKHDFLLCLKGAEKAFLVNDDHCYYLDLTAFGYLRLALNKTAAWLIKQGIIAENDDIGFLKLSEIEALLVKTQNDDITSVDYKSMIGKKKLEFIQQNHIIPPGYMGVPPMMPDVKTTPDVQDNPGVIKGVSGMHKKVSGKVKVISDNNNIQLDEERILVLKHGHSCYFLPLINKIKGLIYDGGSPFDHPGIIARELEIPSIYNTRIASEVLKDGDEVLLDGINGYVSRI